MNRVQTSLLLTALFLSLAPTAQASSTWYVNGVSGSDSNACTSPTSACTTIGHAVSLAASGGSIIVAAATYRENLTIGISLNVIGSGARTTIVDGGGNATVVSVSNATANVTLSQLTIQNGSPSGVYNLGTLALTNSTVRNNYIYKNCANYCAGIGAGIRNGGVVTITDSTIAARWKSGVHKESHVDQELFSSSSPVHCGPRLNARECVALQRRFR